jgi:hypothetical protein
MRKTIVGLVLFVLLVTTMPVIAQVPRVSSPCTMRLAHLLTPARISLFLETAATLYMWGGFPSRMVSIRV